VFAARIVDLQLFVTRPVAKAEVVCIRFA